ERNIWRDEARPLAGFCLDASKTTFLAADPWVTRHNFVYPTVEVVADFPRESSLRDNQFRFPCLDQTATAIRGRGLESVRIGYEETRLPDYYLRWLQRELP